MNNAVAKSKKKLEFHLPYYPLTFHAVHAPVNLAGKLCHTPMRHRSLPLSLKGPQFMLYWGRHQLQGSCNSRSTIFLNFRRRFPTFEQVVRAALHRIFTIFPVVQVHLLEGNIGIFLASLNQGAFTRYLLLESLSLELIFPFFSSLLLYLDLHWPFCETMYNFKFPTLTPLQPPFCLFLRAVTEFLRFPCACRLAWNHTVLDMKSSMDSYPALG